MKEFLVSVMMFTPAVFCFMISGLVFFLPVAVKMHYVLHTACVAGSIFLFAAGFVFLRAEWNQLDDDEIEGEEENE